jgi:hypothetical protein
VTLARAALAMAFLVSAMRSAGAEPCQPRAALDGDSTVVARVGAELARLGVAIATPSPRPEQASTETGACPTARVTVAVDVDGMISVAIREGEGSERRAVSAPALAAVWVDAWLRDELDAMPGEDGGGPSPAPLGPPSVAPRIDVAASVAPRRRSMLDRGALAVAYEQTWSDTHQPWNGIDVAACARLGALCFGTRVRYAAETVVAQATAAARADFTALAIASYSLALGKVELAPEVGVGVGRMTTTRIDGCAPPPVCDPAMASCPAPPCASGAPSGTAYVGDGLAVATITPRGEAALRASVPLFDHVWLDGIAAVNASVDAHTAAFLPRLVPSQLTTAQVTLPGEPVALFQLGIGLRVGAP